MHTNNHRRIRTNIKQAADLSLRFFNIELIRPFIPNVFKIQIELKQAKSGFCKVFKVSLRNFFPAPACPVGMGEGIKIRRSWLIVNKQGRLAMITFDHGSFFCLCLNQQRTDGQDKNPTNFVTHIISHFLLARIHLFLAMPNRLPGGCCHCWPSLALGLLRLKRQGLSTGR